MVKVSRLNHSSFLIEGTKKVIVDPYNIKTDERADIVFITHPHFDHCSVEDIKRVSKEDTIVVMPNMDNAKRICDNHIRLRPWQDYELEGVYVKAVPSYNVDKHYHPRSNGWLGYVIYLDNESIYHAGDTDLIDEMKYLGDVNYALLPVSGTYTMDAESAANATGIIKPSVAVPMHYGGIIGSQEDAEQFRKLCSCEVQLI